MAAKDKDGYFARRAADRRADKMRAKWETLRAGHPAEPEAARPTSPGSSPKLHHHTQPPHHHTQPPHHTEPARPVNPFGGAAPAQPARAHQRPAMLGAPQRAQSVRADMIRGGLTRWSPALWPIVTSAGFVVAFVGGTPVVSGNWDGVAAVGGCALAAAGGFKSFKAASPRTRPFTIGVVAAIVLVVASVAGATSQVVVNGRAELESSETARAVRLARDAERTLDVLRGNQALLGLPPEQAVALLDTYQAAVDQNLEIADTWNPATAGDLPGTGFEAVYLLINRTAVEQAEAIAAYAQNVSEPADALAQKAEELRGRVAESLAVRGVIAAAINDAYQASSGAADLIVDASTDTADGAAEERGR